MAQDEGNGRTSLLARIRHHYLTSIIFITLGIVLIAYAVVVGEQGWCLGGYIALAVLSFLGAIFLWGVSGIMEDASNWMDHVNSLSFWSPIGKVKRVTRQLLEREGWAFMEYSPDEYAKRGRNETIREGFQRRVQMGIDSDNSSKYHIFELFEGYQSIHLAVFSIERFRTTRVSLYPKEKAREAPFSSIIEGLKAELEEFEGFKSIPDWYKRNLELVTERYDEYMSLDHIPPELLEELERNAD